MKIKIGDTLVIHCYKHNGMIHKSWKSAVVLEVNDDFIVLGNENVLVTKQDGRYNTARLSLLQYNNDIENAKIAGIGQVNADAIGQSGLARAQGIQAGANAFSSALAASAQGFASTANGLRTEQANRENVLIGADSRNKVDYLTAETAGNQGCVSGLGMESPPPS